MFGDLAGFDWGAENRAIAVMEEYSASIKRSDSSCSTVSEASNCSGETMEQVMALGSIMDTKKEMSSASQSTASQPNADSKNKRICFSCRRIVWIGGKDSASRVVGPCLAYPLDTE